MRALDSQVESYLLSEESRTRTGRWVPRARLIIATIIQLLLSHSTIVALSRDANYKASYFCAGFPFCKTLDVLYQSFRDYDSFQLAWHDSGMNCVRVCKGRCDELSNFLLLEFESDWGCVEWNWRSLFNGILYTDQSSSFLQYYLEKWKNIIGDLQEFLLSQKNSFRTPFYLRIFLKI